VAVRRACECQGHELRTEPLAARAAVEKLCYERGTPRVLRLGRGEGKGAYTKELAAVRAKNKESL